MADFDQLPIAAVLVDGGGKILAANRAATRLAWRPGVGERVWRGSAQLESEWHALADRAKQAQRNDGPDISHDCEFSSVNGTRYVRAALSCRNYGGALYIFTCFVDITDCAVSDRDASSQRLECLRRIAGGLAHEFNNQLVSVVSGANMLGEDKTLQDELREAVGRIDVSAQRMASITKQLLAFSGRGRFVNVLLDPNALLVEARSRAEKLLASTVALEIEPSVDTVTINADRGMLQQVIVDLIANATEACSEEGGTVRVTGRATPTAWELEVGDDGAGMDPLTLNRIFEPFFTTKPNHRGIGLSAALGIAKSLGGDISVTSRLHHGTTFVLRLPIVEGKTPPQRNSEPRMELLAGLRVLVADDEDAVRQTVQRLLLRRQAIPVVASDGEIAEELLRNELFDVVLLDVMMPKRTGDELIPIARALHPDVPVILMSGFSDRPRGAEVPDAFMEKPFNIHTLETTIYRALRAKRQRSRPSDADLNALAQRGR